MQSDQLTFTFTVQSSTAPEPPVLTTTMRLPEEPNAYQAQRIRQLQHQYNGYLARRIADLYDGRAPIIKLES